MAWETLIPGPGWVTSLPSILGKIVGDRPNQATEQTQADYFAEQAYRNPEAHWDEPFGQSSAATITTSAPPSPLPPTTLPPTTGGGGSSSPAPPTVSPGPSQPTPTQPYQPQGPPLPPGQRGPTPFEVYREHASRSRADSVIRSGRGRVIDPPPPGGWSVILRGLGGLGGVIGGIGGLLWPSNVAPGVLTPEQLEEATRAGREEAEREAAELERALEELARARERAWPTPQPVPLPPLAPIPTPAPPVFSPAPRPAPTPAPRAPAAPAPRAPAAPRSQPVTPQRWSLSPWLTLALLTPGLTGSTARTLTAPRPADPLTPVRPPFGDPLTPGNPLTPSMPTPSGLTPFNRPPLQSRTRQDRCRCKKCKEPKRRKKRKCLERAQLSWRTGRKKGQPAGSRCVRFAT